MVDNNLNIQTDSDLKSSIYFLLVDIDESQIKLDYIPLLKDIDTIGKYDLLQYDFSEIKINQKNEIYIQGIHIITEHSLVTVEKILSNYNLKYKLFRLSGSVSTCFNFIYLSPFAGTLFLS